MIELYLGISEMRDWFISQTLGCIWNDCKQAAV